MQQEIDRLIGGIRALGKIAPSRDTAWVRCDAVKVIDCVLSLNRKYDRFVVPRLDHFEAAFPSVKRVSELRIIIDSFDSSAEFFLRILQYRDASRARMLSVVVDKLIAETAKIGLAEETALREWARTALPTDYKHWAVAGFALAGFQYMRMLFDANTVKPDVHICAWVGECIDRKIGPAEALQLLELAARKYPVSLRDLDTTIWELRARSMTKSCGQGS